MFSSKHFNIGTIFLLVQMYEENVLTLTKISRSDMGAYLCIASNGVPPSVSKRIQIKVHCKYTSNLHYFLNIKTVRCVVFQIFPSQESSYGG